MDWKEKILLKHLVVFFQWRFWKQKMSTMLFEFTLNSCSLLKAYGPWISSLKKYENVQTLSKQSEWLWYFILQVSRDLGKLYSEMIFVQGYVHCDPHPGNVLVNKTKKGTQIVLLDHGLYQVYDFTDTLTVFELMGNYCINIGATCRWHLFLMDKNPYF